MKIKKIKWYWIPIIGMFLVFLLRTEDMHADFFDMEKPDYYGSMYMHMTCVWWVTLVLISEILKMT